MSILILVPKRIPEYVDPGIYSVLCLMRCTDQTSTYPNEGSSCGSLAPIIHGWRFGG